MKVYVLMLLDSIEPLIEVHKTEESALESANWTINGATGDRITSIFDLHQFIENHNWEGGIYEREIAV